MARELLLRALLGEAGIHLDAAAIELATFEYPGLDPAPYLRLLDDIAEQTRRRVGQDLDSMDPLHTLQAHLGRTMGFRGNENDYFNVRNSCLNDVLETHLGIPITLAVVYLEVGRRLGVPLVGIGMPGHFVVQYRGEDLTTYLDPFHRGRFLTEYDCVQMALDVAQVDIAADPEALEPVTEAYILARMLNNLGGVYARNGDYKKVVQVLDLLIEANPRVADLYKQRASARVQIRQLKRAIGDYQSYLDYAPNAGDRDEMLKRMDYIQTWLRTLN